MAGALAEVTFKAPTMPVVTNVSAEGVLDPEVIRASLVEQITGAVRWRESVAFMVEQGVTEFYEVGAGKALSGMIRRINRDATCMAVSTPEDVAAAVAEIN
jgi:[acyl-carrier-protein] S-malonyltransferase